MNSIIEYYNNYDEEGRLKRKSHLPEYLTAMYKMFYKKKTSVMEVYDAVYQFLSGALYK